MLPPGLLVIHDAAGGGEDHVAELSGGQQVVGPLLDLVDGDIESGGDHATLVQTTWKNIFEKNLKIKDKIMNIS